LNWLGILNIGWIAYYAVLAFRRARIRLPLVICLMLFVPLAVNLLLFLVQGVQGQQSLRLPILHPLLIILVLSYLTFEQFRKQLVTRQLLKARVLQTQQDVNALRRQEIDGIGRDLHDQVGNTLATAMGYLSRLPVDTQKPRAIIISAIREL